MALVFTKSYPTPKTTPAIKRYPTPIWINPPYNPIPKKINICQMFIFFSESSFLPWRNFFGSISINTIIMSMITAMALSNISSLISTATHAPINDPITAGIPKSKPFLVSSTFCLLKLATEAIFCARIPIRFVPFATLAGKPISINKGREIIDPPPARVLINPTKTPATIRIMISYVFIWT